MGTHHQGSATIAQIPNQFIGRFELGAGWLVAIEIAYEANAQPDVVHIIAVNVATVDLTAPAIANLDPAIARRRSVSNDKMVSQSVPHSPHSPVIIIERARVPLPRPAIVHDDKFPASASHRRSPDCLNVRTGQITIIDRLARPGPETTARWRGWWRFETLFSLQARFLDRDIGRQRGLRQGNSRNRTWTR